MAIGGTYKIEIKTPLGNQEANLTFSVKGNVLNGSSESSFG
jgi:hypothetical protein